MKEKVFIVVQYFYRWDETYYNVFDTKEGVREFVSEVHKEFKEHPEEYGFNDDINEVKDDCKQLGRWKKTNYSIDIFDDCNGFHLYTVECEMNNKDFLTKKIKKMDKIYLYVVKTIDNECSSEDVFVSAFSNLEDAKCHLKNQLMCYNNTQSCDVIKSSEEFIEVIRHNSIHEFVYIKEIGVDNYDCMNVSNNY